MLDYEFETRAIFSLTKIPQHADWDECWVPPALAHDGCPIAIRVVGCIIQLDQPDDGEGPKLEITLDLLREVDYSAFVGVMKKGDARSCEYYDAEREKR